MNSVAAATMLLVHGGVSVTRRDGLRIPSEPFVTHSRRRCDAFAMPFNADGMFRGHIGAEGEPRVAIWPDERV